MLPAIALLLALVLALILGVLLVRIIWSAILPLNKCRRLCVRRRSRRRYLLILVPVEWFLVWIVALLLVERAALAVIVLATLTLRLVLLGLSG